MTEGGSGCGCHVGEPEASHELEPPMRQSWDTHPGSQGRSPCRTWGPGLSESRCGHPVSSGQPSPSLAHCSRHPPDLQPAARSSVYPRVLPVLSSLRGVPHLLWARACLPGAQEQPQGKFCQHSGHGQEALHPKIFSAPLPVSQSLSPTQ